MKKELDHEDSHLNLDETARLLQDLHEAQAERGGSRPSSNLSSLSTASEREQHPPGKGLRWIGDQAQNSGLGTEVYSGKFLYPCVSLGARTFVWVIDLLTCALCHSTFYSLAILTNEVFIFYQENINYP